MKEFERFNQNKNTVAGILELVNTHAISFLDACVLYSEKNNLEIEVIAENIKKSEIIVGNLELEAESLNFLKKISRLPF